jgi:hypothetical protein
MFNSSVRLGNCFTYSRANSWHRFSYVLSFSRDEPSPQPGAPDNLVWRPVLRRRVLQYRRAASQYLQVLQYSPSTLVWQCRGQMSIFVFVLLSQTLSHSLSLHNTLLCCLLYKHSAWCFKCCAISKYLPIFQII